MFTLLLDTSVCVLCACAQIERQLNAYLKRVEDVLGKGWENHVEGKALKGDGDSFRLKLNTQELFDDWQRKVTSKQLGVSGHIFDIESVRSRQQGKGNVLKLKVNFMPEIITLAKEVGVPVGLVLVGASTCAKD